VAAPQVCVPAGENETDVTVNCALNGEVNPWNVSETEAWFQWGRTPALGSETPKQPVATGEGLVPLSAPVEGLRPNELVFYRLAGFDQNVKSPESPLSSETVSFLTPTIPPKVLGVPGVSFVAPFSAVFFGELNPENANTHYAFQYGACKEGLDACSGGVAETTAVESSEYGRIGATLEARGLLPATVYRYRLIASNEHEVAGKPVGGKAAGLEGEFTTAAAPVAQVVTGGASAVGRTSAVISGMVNPDGQAATYTFELGAYEGSETQYGILFSGPAGSGSVPVNETLGLSGLQPATTYAYRITIKTGAAEPVRGEPMTFTTQGLPSALSVPTILAQLAVPSIAFPKEPANVTHKTLTQAQKLANALKACAKKPKAKRAVCRSAARKKYVVNTNAKGKKHAGGKKHG
jgi:hypothetical protein